MNFRRTGPTERVTEIPVGGESIGQCFGETVDVGSWWPTDGRVRKGTNPAHRDHVKDGGPALRASWKEAGGNEVSESGDVHVDHLPDPAPVAGLEWASISNPASSMRKSILIPCVGANLTMASNDPLFQYPRRRRELSKVCRAIQFFQRIQSVQAAGDQNEGLRVGRSCRANSSPNPEEAPVMSAVNPS